MDSIILFIVCFCIFCVVLFLIIWLGSTLSDKNKVIFDERQLIARNKAYKYAFFVLLLYFTAVEAIDILGVLDFHCSSQSNLGIGLFLSIGTFTVTSIFNDAYIPIINGRPIHSIILYSLLGFSQLYYGMKMIEDNGGIIYDGQINIPIFLSFSILFFMMSLSLLIKLIIDKKASKEKE